MLWLDRFTPHSVKRTPVALALTLIAAVACADRTATAPHHAATDRATTDIIPPTNPFDDLWVSPHRQVVAGNSSTGWVHLNQPAPAGGAHMTVKLAHSTPFVSFDTTLFVPEGATSQSFLVQTYAEPDTLGIALYADWGSWRGTGAFTLLPAPIPPSISLVPGGLTFGPQAVGSSSTAQIITLRNNGTVPLTLNGIVVNGPFAQTNNCPPSLAPNQTCTIWVTYVPTAAGAQSGSLVVTSNAPSSPNVIPLNGTGFVRAPALSIMPAVIGFGSVTLGLGTSGRPFKITSTGNAPLVISSLTLGGANPGDFLISADGCSGVTLLPGASCTAAVSFEPLRIGTRTATVTIAHNAGDGWSTVSVSGTGKKGGPYIP